MKKQLPKKSARHFIRAFKRFVFLLILLSGIGLIIGVVLYGINTSKSVKLDPEYRGASEEIELSSEGYEELISAKKSFLIFIDQTGCITAHRLREYIEEYASSNSIKFYHFMWDDVKSSSLHAHVKYYPSIVLVSRGMVVGFLKADENDHSKYYNNYPDFKNYLDNFLKNV